MQRRRLISTMVLVCVFGLFLLGSRTASAQVAQEVDIPVKQWMFVGFTQTQYVIGDIGAMMGAAQKCQVEFEAAKMCTLKEFSVDSVIPVTTEPGASGVVWDDGGSMIDRTTDYFHGQCINFTNTTYNDPVVTVEADGTVPIIGTTYNPGCAMSASIACCALKKVPEPTASLQLGSGILGLAAIAQSAAKGKASTRRTKRMNSRR